MANMIRNQTIITRVAKRLNPPPGKHVRHDDPVSDYITGGKAEIADHFNKHKPFRNDGLSLKPKNIPRKPKVHHIVRAIRQNYEKRGWVVVVMKPR